MRLVAVYAVLAAAAVTGVSPNDLFCDCRLGDQRDWQYVLHCTSQQVESSVVYCEKTWVPNIPRGYHYVPGYALIKLHRTFRTWPDAKTTCEAEGAHLAVPPDRHAYDGLKQIFRKEKGIWYAFLGITDQASEGVFVGLDGHPVSHLPWTPNEPNNGNGEGEDCVNVRNDGLLNDAKCGGPEPFLCERRLTVGVPESYTWCEEAGRFYKVHLEKKVYAEAAKQCRSENATLAVPDTWPRALALMRLVEPQYDGYLLGLTDEAVEGDFVTETGRHLKHMEFQAWGVNQPDNSDQGKPENCLSLQGIGALNDVRCDSELPFFCEIVPV